jgi:predicted RNA-binding protein associated with RNAse of E/G family
MGIENQEPRTSGDMSGSRFLVLDSTNRKSREVKEITIQLLKPGKGQTIRYTGEIVRQEPGYVLVHARWEHPRRDLGYVVFEPGDNFFEHYFSTYWYNICELRSPAGDLKGWYCNVTRPAQIERDTILSEDLELDLFVSPDRSTILRLDLDEFAARGLDSSDRAAHAAALAALDELERMAREGLPPFDSV